MSGCEFHGEYTQFFTDRIAIELVGNGKSLNGREEDSVWNIVQGIALSRHSENLLPAEAEKLTNLVFELFPQYKESFEAKLTEMHLQ